MLTWLWSLWRPRKPEVTLETPYYPQDIPSDETLSVGDWEQYIATLRRLGASDRAILIAEKRRDRARMRAEGPKG